mgnify:CR=1 FL=1
MAPPIFIILFGTMLEIVYKTRFEQGRAVQATSRLLTRALQCYLLYVVTILSMLAAGHTTPGYALRCILMMGVTPYADILKFYTLALAFAPAQQYAAPAAAPAVVDAAPAAAAVAEEPVAAPLVRKTPIGADLFTQLGGAFLVLLAVMAAPSFSGQMACVAASVVGYQLRALQAFFGPSN